MHNRRKPYEKYKEDRHPRPRRGFSAIRAKLLSGRTQFAPTIGFFIIDFEFAPRQAFPFEKLRIFRDGGPRQRWMRCWNLTDGKKQQYRRAGIL